MPRNLVICCDGTNNEFSGTKTNVARLAKVLVRDDEQLVFYDPGVGTLPEPTILNRWRSRVRRYMSLAFGFGLTLNVQEAYTFLMNHWEQGDRVYLFGFSRGAYTVRVLAGLLHVVGLLPRGNEQLVPYLMRLYGGIRDRNASEDAEGETKYWRLVNEFRGTFARSIDGQDSRMFPIHFCGVWDTVSSVGWVWEPLAYPFTAANPGIATVRHAVSIDERRWFFRQNLFKPGVKRQDLVELWFAGAHADVGGGYKPDEGWLWRFAFEWIVAEAKVKELRVNENQLAAELARAKGPLVAEHIHDSLTWKWWPAEFFPKRVYSRTRGRHFGIGLFSRRHVHDGAQLHRSALGLIGDSTLKYQPTNLAAAFRESIGQLGAELPDSLEYSARE